MQKTLQMSHCNYVLMMNTALLTIVLHVFFSVAYWYCQTRCALCRVVAFLYRWFLPTFGAMPCKLHRTCSRMESYCGTHYTVILCCVLRTSWLDRVVPTPCPISLFSHCAAVSCCSHCTVLLCRGAHTVLPCRGALTVLCAVVLTLWCYVVVLTLFTAAPWCSRCAAVGPDGAPDCTKCWTATRFRSPSASSSCSTPASSSAKFSSISTPLRVSAPLSAYSPNPNPKPNPNLPWHPRHQ